MSDTTTIEQPTSVALDHVTPYGGAKLVNAWLKRDGKRTPSGKSKLPSQMIYSYTTGRLNKGGKPGIPCFVWRNPELGKDQVRIRIKDLKVWYTKYTAPPAELTDEDETEQAGEAEAPKPEAPAPKPPKATAKA